MSYTALNPEDPDHAGHAREVLDGVIKSAGENKTSAIAMQINSMDLPPGDKIWLLSVENKYKETHKKSEKHRKEAIRYEVLYGICAAVVPIAIPFSQTYKEQTVSVFGSDVNVGAVISLLAVLASLIGTVLHAVEKGSKVKEMASLYAQEADQTEQEYSLFLGRAGKYGEQPTNTDQFKMFVKEYTKIRVQCSRSSLFTHYAAEDQSGNPSSPKAGSRGDEGDKGDNV